MSKNKVLYVMLSLVVSVLLIWFLLSQIKISDLASIFSGIYFPALYAFIAVAFIGAVLRAWRYKWFLKPHPISWGDIFLVTLIRNLFVDLFPARLGSLSYVYILNKRLNFSFEVASSSFILAVIFDFLTLSPFLVGAIFAVGLGTTAISSFTLFAAAVAFFILSFIFLWKIIPLFSFFLKIYQKLLKALRIENKNWAALSVQKTRLIIDCLFRVKKRKIYWQVFLLSLLIRLAKYASLYFLLFSILKSQAFLLKDLSFSKTILCITGAELSSVMPVKGIAGFGTWETAWAIAFGLMNFGHRLNAALHTMGLSPELVAALVGSSMRRLAILSGIGLHLITNIFEYTLGIISILILAMPFKKKPKSKTDGF